MKLYRIYATVSVGRSKLWERDFVVEAEDGPDAQGVLGRYLKAAVAARGLASRYRINIERHGDPLREKLKPDCTAAAWLPPHVVEAQREAHP